MTIIVNGFQVTTASGADPSPDQIANFSSAISYLQGSGTASDILANLQAKGTVIVLNSNNEDGYIEKTNTLEWDPNSAAVVQTNSGWGLVSPALGLIHEAYHATDPNLDDEESIPLSGWGNLAERAAVAAQNAVADDLGEVQQTSYTNQMYARVGDSTTSASSISDSAGQYIARGDLILGNPNAFSNPDVSPSLEGPPLIDLDPLVAPIQFKELPDGSYSVTQTDPIASGTETTDATFSALSGNPNTPSTTLVQSETTGSGTQSPITITISADILPNGNPSSSATVSSANTSFTLSGLGGVPSFDVDGNVVAAFAVGSGTATVTLSSTSGTLVNDQDAVTTNIGDQTITLITPTNGNTFAVIQSNSGASAPSSNAIITGHATAWDGRTLPLWSERVTHNDDGLDDRCTLTQLLDLDVLFGVPEVGGRLTGRPLEHQRVL